MNKETQLQRGNRWLLLLLLVAGSMTGYAQSRYFTYADGSNGTVITGLSEDGAYATSLTIPATVTNVSSGAFANADPKLTSLTIENGGNPTFVGSLFGTKANTLTYIKMGDGMTVANMIALLQSLGTDGPTGTVEASGFTGTPDATADTWNVVTWTNATSITLPAELVGTQTFGSATVYGRFNIDKEIISFCTNATFYDEDDGSNMLFYVADYKAEDGRLHIQRVHFVAAGKGVLIHRLDNSSGYCDLKRVSGIPSASDDNNLYTSNMLVGVTKDTPITVTSSSNIYVLKDGAFHPAKSGTSTIKANRAYLQLPSSARAETLAIEFPDEETEIKSLTPAPSPMEEGSGYYDLQGRKLDTKPTTKGIYINNGKKYIIR